MSRTILFRGGDIVRRVNVFHVNYVRQFVFDDTPSGSRFYAGPTINMVTDSGLGKEFGIGGIVGMEYRLADKTKFDVRYELSTKTNRIQVGLIHTFQKEYKWMKY